MMATTTKSEFKRERRDGRYVYVKRLSLGGEVLRVGSEYHAVNRGGQFLGWTSDQEEAEWMAQEGYTNSTCEDGANPLSLWLAWNDAVDGGATVLQSEAGDQVILLGDCVYLIARDDDGWEVELITDVELGERYASTERGGVRKLKRITSDQAFRLE